MKNPTVKFYESGVIDQALGDTIRPGGLSLTKRLAEVLGIDESWRILDIACGKGTTTSFLSREYGCHVVGIDLSYKLISMAESKEGLVLGDAARLPFRDATFDAVVSECSFSLLLDKEAGAREIRRILKTGGKLAMTDVFLKGELTVRPQSEVAFASCIAGAMKLVEYTSLFQDAGFKAPYVEDHSKELKKAAWQIIATYGTMNSFLTCSGDSSAEDWRKMFQEGKPGYALIVTTKL